MTLQVHLFWPIRDPIARHGGKSQAKAARLQEPAVQGGRKFRKSGAHCAARKGNRLAASGGTDVDGEDTFRS